MIGTLAALAITMKRIMELEAARRVEGARIVAPELHVNLPAGTILRALNHRGRVKVTETMQGTVASVEPVRKDGSRDMRFSVGWSCTLRVADYAIECRPPPMLHDVVWTDYPVTAMGDTAGKEAPIRRGVVQRYDGDKFCQVQIDGCAEPVEIKTGYLYAAPGRHGEAPPAYPGKWVTW